MSLDWNISKVDNYEELLEGEEWRKTEQIIWGCMGIGIGTITKDNYMEWYTRYDLWYRDASSLNVLDVRRRIGLTTNVFPKEGKTKFLNRVYNSLLRDNVSFEKRKDEQDASEQSSDGHTDNGQRVCEADEGTGTEGGIT